VVQSLAPALGGGNGYPQVLFDLVLPGKVAEGTGAKAAIEVGVLGLGFAGNNALYFFFLPLSPQKISDFSGSPKINPIIAHII
jgi:hypothetical protein